MEVSAEAGMRSWHAKLVSYVSWHGMLLCIAEHCMAS